MNAKRGGSIPPRFFTRFFSTVCETTPYKTRNL